MLQERAGELAGKIWNTLNEKGEMSVKVLKKTAKIRFEKDLYLGLGWLLREGKLNVKTEGADDVISLK